MAHTQKPHPLVATVLQELNAVRTRMDQPQERPRGGEAAMKGAALAEEVKRLCWEASLSSDNEQVETLLSESRHRLDELQKLLGVH